MLKLCSVLNTTTRWGQKIIEFVKSEGDADVYKITSKGKKILQKYSFISLVIPKPKSWNGKWHIVLFDIPTNRSVSRNALRAKLQEMEFFPFQKSAWVYPFPCEEEVYFIADVFNVSGYLEVFTIENFNDTRALKYFKRTIADFLD